MISNLKEVKVLYTIKMSIFINYKLELIFYLVKSLQMLRF